MRNLICAAALLLAPAAGVAQQPAAGARESFVKVCGGCHPVETVTGQRRARAQWQDSINAMVARGAKGTDEELLEAIATVSTQPSLRAEMGERGYQAFRRMWDRPAHMRLYFEFIRNAALKKLGRVPWE